MTAEDHPLNSLFEDHEVSEIVVNSTSVIYYEKDGKFYKHTNSFKSPQDYKLFLHKLCQATKMQYDINTPFADGYLHPFRIHLVAPPLSKNTLLTIRRLKTIPWTLDDLKSSDWADDEQLHFLRNLILTKKNILVIGPTGSGKTSCISALLRVIPITERVVIIEDTEELVVPNELSVKLLTRVDLNGHLKTFTQEDLIKQSLRMRPHRLVIGEVRGRESKDLLLALSTGHPGSLCSLHADDPHQALLRLEMLVKMGAPEWEIQSIRRLIYLSMHYIVTLGFKNEKRSLINVHKIAGLESNGLNISKIY